jgi:hypothetical protein
MSTSLSLDASPSFTEQLNNFHISEGQNHLKIFEDAIYALIKPLTTKEELITNLAEKILQALENEELEPAEIHTTLLKFSDDGHELLNEVMFALLRQPQTKRCPFFFSAAFDFGIRFSAEANKKILGEKAALLRILYPMMLRAFNETESEAFIEALKVTIKLQPTFKEVEELLRQLHVTAIDLEEAAFATFLDECFNLVREYDQHVLLAILCKFVEDQTLSFDTIITNRPLLERVQTALKQRDELVSLNENDKPLKEKEYLLLLSLLKRFVPFEINAFLQATLSGTHWADPGAELEVLWKEKKGCTGEDLNL